MEDYQQRMIEERQELNEKIIKLATFIFSRPVKVEKDENARMKKQLYIMMEYSDILDDRINIFT